jgi:Ca-activated chloride channel family protein
VQVVEVYASVTDARGEPVRGLRQDQFTVREDGQPQVISTFVEGDFPLAVAVAIDRSWSMAGERLALAKEGARTLLGELRSTDQAMVVAISGQIETVAPLSAERGTQAATIDGLDPWSTTALHDAVIAAIDRVHAGYGRRALVLLSDSRDRYSRADAATVLEHARGADVMVYPVVLGRERSALFSELAVLTGGRSFEAGDRAAVTAAVRAIARELRTQYLIGYSPLRPRTEGVGEWRSIRVDVQAPGARARARDGYVNR